MLSGDKRAFFHQIFVREDDNAAFRFFWYKDKELTQMALYEMLVHVFGATSSPAVSTFVLRYLGEMLRGKVSPEVVWAILFAFYVDDLLISFPDVETAKRIQKELHKALLDHGFELCKFKSTHRGVLDEKDEEAAGEIQEKLLEDPKAEAPMDKVLGVTYSFHDDKFSIKVGKKAERKASTRRELLSLIASIFDPLGFFSPATLKGKILFQKVTALGLDWDDLIAVDLLQQIQNWQSSLIGLERIKIDRWVATSETTKGSAEIHVFCDASIDDYGIAVYLVMRSDDGQVTVTLIFSRAHVVPLDMARKIIKDQEDHHGSVPRLELTAARLGASVKDMIIREFKDTVSIQKSYMWTDSETVLKWIRDTKTRFKTFIKNRLTKIHELTRPEDWMWVPSELNPADDCSRGLDPMDEKWERFVGGPKFLQHDQSGWPKQKYPKPDICINAMTVAKHNDAKYDWALRIATKIGDWPSKVRRVATFVNFFKVWRANREKFSLKKTFPTVNDLNTAQDKLLIGIQQKSFPKEMESLNKQLNAGEEQELKSAPASIMPLNAFIDPIGLLRAGGRLANSMNISYDTKYPKILPKDDPNIEALIRLEHENQGHAALEGADCDADPKTSTSSIPDILEIHVDDDFDNVDNDICNGEAEDKNIPAPKTDEDNLSLIDSEEEFGDENDATIAWVEEPKQGTEETKAAAKRRRDRMRRKRNRVRTKEEKKMVWLGQKSLVEVEEEKQ